MTSVDPQSRVGTLIGGRYRIDKMIGRGGMGVVLAGTHEMTDRRVAIKLLLPEVARDADVIGRFFQEAKSAAGLDHPNVVDTLDMGIEEGTGQPYLVLELLDGEDLAHRIAREGPMDSADLIPIVLPVIDALAAAHEHGIVHRDLKPENIFISKDARGRPMPKVLDFGIAKLIEGESRVKTRAGGVLGTPYYMSPEQAMGTKDLGPASDVWSMGVVLYECLGGRMPFSSATLTGVLMQICTVDPPPLLEVAPHVDPYVAGVVGRAMQRTVEDRIQTMQQLGSELTAAAEASGIELPPAVTGLFEKLELAPEPSEAPAPIELVTPSVHPPHKFTERLSAPEELAETSADEPSVALPEPTRRGGGRVALALIGLAALAGVAALAVWYLRPPSPPSESHAVAALPEAERETSAAGSAEPPPGSLTGDPDAEGADREADAPGVDREDGEPESTPVDEGDDAPGDTEAATDGEPGGDTTQDEAEEEDAPEEEPERAAAPASAAARRRAARARAASEARRGSSASSSTPTSTSNGAPSTAAGSAEPSRRPAVDPSRGRVIVRTQGGWAEVFHQGRRLGRTPLTTRLPVGIQRLRVVPFGTGRPRSVNVNVEWGAVADVVLEVAPELPEAEPGSAENP